LASYTLAFALQPRKKHGKTSVRVAAYVKKPEIFKNVVMKMVHVSVWFKHVVVNETFNVALRGTVMTVRVLLEKLTEYQIVKNSPFFSLHEYSFAPSQ
jgi:hypothetical protein